MSFQCNIYLPGYSHFSSIDLNNVMISHILSIDMCGYFNKCTTNLTDSMFVFVVWYSRLLALC